MKLKGYLSGLLCLPRCPWSRGSVSSPKRFLYTVLTSVFFLKDYGVKRSLNLESCVAGKGSEVFTHSLCNCQPYASSPEPSAYVLQIGCGRKTFPLFVCLATESHHNLLKVWSTLKLEELPSFIRVDDLKAIKLTTGIGTLDSCAVFQPLEEFVAFMHLLDVHWVPILRKLLKLNTVTMSLTMHVI